MQKGSILIVNFGKRIPSPLENYLIDNHYTILKAFNTEEILTVLSTSKPDVIILENIDLSDISGIEALKEIRYESTIPIMVTTWTDEPEKTILQAFEEGADDVFINYYSLELLAKKLQAILRRVLQ